MLPASSSAGTGRPESGARGSGNGPATMARRSGSPPPSTPWNASAGTRRHDPRARRQRKQAVNSAIARAVLASVAAGGGALVFVYTPASGGGPAREGEKGAAGGGP